MQPVKRKNSYLGLIIVVSTLTILMLILIVAIGIFFFTNQFGAARARDAGPLLSQNLLNRIEVDQIDPALALASLGGVSEADVIIEAVRKARPETALAALLFHPTLTDKESAGDFLLLAAAYVDHGDKERGTFSYQMACTIATLSPTIADTVRADIFLQASEGFMRLQQDALAKFYLDQAFTLASRSPFLQAAHRRSVFERLQKDYISLGEREWARRSLDFSANPPALTLIAEDVVLPQNNTAVPLSAEAQEAEANRWRRAQELAALLVERGGHAPQAARDGLKEALIAEDEQKVPFYENELAAATQLSGKIDITVARISWLSTKYRVARRAYGLSLVPEWEAQAEQIRADLTKSYETLFALYADLIVALPEVSQIDKATEERLRREILAGELGRYPNYPQEQRRRQLQEATNQLIATQPELNIFIGTTQVNGQEIYSLISPEAVSSR